MRDGIARRGACGLCRRISDLTVRVEVVDGKTVLALELAEVRLGGFLAAVVAVEAANPARLRMTFRFVAAVIKSPV